MSNRAYMHRDGLGGPVNLPKAIHLLECAHRKGIKTPSLYTISSNKKLALEVLDVIWDDLVAGQPFTKDFTLDFLSFYVAKNEIITQLKNSPQGTSLVFLKQLKTNPNHPLSLILNHEYLNQKNETLKALMTDAATLLNTRITFFSQGHKKVEHSPFNLLPQEINNYLFSFVQPSFELDKEENYCLPKLKY
ncbi:SEL1-like repeat protein [Legionella gresilensis]|uniref:SEL1-like repeat protein n=1 Tax=Legionella gresilensis TaxID=91823 RepID=UPI001040E1CC|nr:SEL1-like repeat protein [Legionella gresilensis]